MRIWGSRRGISLIYPALAAVLTWPLAAHLTDRLVYGTEDATTVGQFNLWTLRWNQDRAGHLFAHYWDAPIFHPTAGAFGLSEPQPLTGLVFAPLAWLTGNPVLAANLVTLAILALNGWAAARLARHLGVADGPALLAAVLAQALPFVMNQMGVLQLTVVFPLFLLIDAILRWARADTERRRAAVEVGVWVSVTFLTCGYYGLFAVVAVGGPALVLGGRGWVRRERLVDLGIAAGIFAVTALPIVVAQGRITDDYHRSDEVIGGLSAEAGDFWHLDPHAHGAGFLPWVGDDAGHQPLYPGTVLLGLGLVGLVLLVLRWDDDSNHSDGSDDSDGSRQRRRIVIFLGLGAALARVLALGLTLHLGGWQPYHLLQDFVPGFASLRSPFRFAVIGEVFLVALAAFALDALWRKHAAVKVVAVAIVALGVLEVGIMPVRLFSVDQATPDWADWLGDAEHAGTDDPVVAFLPFPPHNGVAAYEETATRMLQALDEHIATVNGYSGLFPTQYDELEPVMRLYPTDGADDMLAERGLTHLVVDEAWLHDRAGAREWLAYKYDLAFTGEDTEVYASRS